MSQRPEFLTTRPDQVHPIQVKLAFLEDAGEARPALVSSFEGEVLQLRELDGSASAVRVHGAARLAEVLGRDDLCRVQGLAFVLVNEQYRVVAVATGPATPPSPLSVLIVSRLEDGGVVELMSSSDDQPAWQVFALRKE